MKKQDAVNQNQASPFQRYNQPQTATQYVYPAQSQGTYPSSSGYQGHSQAYHYQQAQSQPYSTSPYYGQAQQAYSTPSKQYPSPPSSSGFATPPGSAGFDYHAFQSQIENLAKLDKNLAETGKELPRAFCELGIKPGHKAQVVLMLDISISMEHPNKFFTSGRLNRLIQQLLTLAFMIDDDHTIQVIPFGKQVHDPIEVGLTADPSRNIIAYDQLVNHILGNYQLERATNYYLPMQKLCNMVNENFPKKSKSSGKSILRKQSADLPIFALFLTDGNCNCDEALGKRQFMYSSYMPIFIKAIGLEGSETKFDELEELDDWPVKGQKLDKAHQHVHKNQRNFIDNFDFVQLEKPEDINAKLLLQEYPGWLAAASQKGMLELDPCINPKKINKDDRMVADKPKKKSSRHSTSKKSRRASKHSTHSTKKLHRPRVRH